MAAKTGALWERKEETEEEEDVPSGNSKLFLNRRIHRDFRVNEIFRKKSTKLDDVDDEDDDKDEFGLPKTDTTEKEHLETVKEEKQQTEETKVTDDKTEHKKVSYIFHDLRDNCFNPFMLRYCIYAKYSDNLTL